MVIPACIDAALVAERPIHRSLEKYSQIILQGVAFAFANQLDYVALSFVRSGDDVRALKAHMEAVYGRTLPIISKIEKPEAVENLVDIISESSAIMIARGDLGVEVPAVEVPLIQKSIIRSCIDAGVPVITATQMLESMMHNPRPTSAVMLSGETAAGEYPLQAVTTMARIARLAERSNAFRRQVFNQISTRELALSIGADHLRQDQHDQGGGD